MSLPLAALPGGTALAGLIGLALLAGTNPAAPAQVAAASSVAQITAPAQTVAGFGASGAWWVNDLANFSAANQAKAASLLFTTAGLDLSQYRYNIGGGGVGVAAGPRAASTFLTSSGSYDWTKDPTGQYFLKTAAADGVPDLIGFVNSAPEQYTSNNESCAGTLVAADEAAYGSYLATVASHFAAQGVTLNEISPMNEPDNSFSSCSQEGMAVPASERAGTIGAVGSALQSAGLSTKVIADESSKTTQLLSEAPTWLADSSAPSYTAAIAHHTYDFPGATQMELVAALGDVNNKAKWATEICCQVTGGGYGAQYDPTISGGVALAKIVYNDFAYGDDSAFQWWTALSPVMGCDPTTSSTCATSVNSSGYNDGLIYYNPNYAADNDQNFYISKRFYVLAQYSRFVRPGAVRYGLSGAPSGVQALAFWANNAWTVVATNTNSSATSFSLNLNSGTITSQGAYRTSASENVASISAPSISGSTISTSLPAQSVSTFVLGSSGQPGSGGVNASELVGSQSGRCLAVPGSSTTNGTQVDIETCSAASNQEFTLQPGGTVTVYGNKCLDAYQQGK
ncbi:glycoside hydrolase, partial [Actinocrinis sp.]|uniref:glycoside hydrolase n=1 Tax=Actinocrinis sp. TaxID=1920516 RepID=UPI002D495A9A